jgi:hypothetical protein
MMNLSVELHAVKDGLPDEDMLADGRVAFLWNNEVLTGSPSLDRRDWWEDVYGTTRANVWFWLLFPEPIGKLAVQGPAGA